MFPMRAFVNSFRKIKEPIMLLCLGSWAVKIGLIVFTRLKLWSWVSLWLA